MARILVAEDDPSANKLICAVLRKDGHETLAATDGQEALDLLDHEHVDLIVSDIMMPCIDGLELVRQLREAEWNNTGITADGTPGCRIASCRIPYRCRRLPH